MIIQQQYHTFTLHNNQNQHGKVHFIFFIFTKKLSESPNQDKLPECPDMSKKQGTR